VLNGLLKRDTGGAAVAVAMAAEIDGKYRRRRQERRLKNENSRRTTEPATAPERCGAVALALTFATSPAAAQQSQQQWTPEQRAACEPDATW
jgi:hypothetical protein